MTIWKDAVDGDEIAWLKMKNVTYDDIVDID
jgi:hypothetical protein